MNNLADIKFWALQFTEHCEFLKKIIMDESKKNPREPSLHEAMTSISTLDKLKQAWVLVSQNPKSNSAQSLMEETFSAKGQIKQLVTKADLLCIPDLVEHMIEELQYFQESVLDQSYTHDQEMVYWATEHAENLAFVNCQLPELLKADSGKVNPPAFIKQASAENEALIQEFQTIHDHSDHNKLIRLKLKHMKGTTNLLKQVPELPLKDKTKTLLSKMLVHELREATFAFNRMGFNLKPWL